MRTSRSRGSAGAWKCPRISFLQSASHGCSQPRMGRSGRSASAAGFMKRTTPPRSTSVIGPGLSMGNEARCSIWACACRVSVMSRKTMTTPEMPPFSSWIGAPLSSMGISVPSFRMRTVWPDRPTTHPSRSTRSTGSLLLSRVCSSTMLKILVTCSETASLASQPVIFSATAFMKVTRPLAVGGDDGVADGRKGRLPAPPAFAQFPFGLFCAA